MNAEKYAFAANLWALAGLESAVTAALPPSEDLKLRFDFLLANPDQSRMLAAPPCGSVPFWSFSSYVFCRRDRS